MENGRFHHEMKRLEKCGFSMSEPLDLTEILEVSRNIYKQFFFFKNTNKLGFSCAIIFFFI